MRVNIAQIRDMKQKGEKIAMLTAYDYSTAKIVDESGVPLILVGDSLGMVVLGYENPIPVTVDVMIHHTKAVVRGSTKALIVGDMPFMSYHVSMEEALHNAGRFIQEAGCQSVKLEGGVTVADKVRRMVQCGIPVMGHIGLTPQSVNQLGGWRVQGKTPEAASQLMEDALALEEAGAFSVVLEQVPTPLATLISRKLKIPTIGIGAGNGCDGQVLVIHDVFGLSDRVPKLAKKYADVGAIMRKAVTEYYGDVKSGAFPSEANSFTMDESLLAALE